MSNRFPKLPAIILEAGDCLEAGTSSGFERYGKSRDKQEQNVNMAAIFSIPSRCVNCLVYPLQSDKSIAFIDRRLDKQRFRQTRFG
jgi:hypothetical protein